MRAPNRRRPLRRTIAAKADQPDPELHVKYVGSPEHKRHPSPAGYPKPRADASLCPEEITGRWTDLSEWLRESFAKGWVSAQRDGDHYPRYVWYRHEQTVFEGRLVNRTQGEYKGYPLERSEWPEGLPE